MSTTSHEPFCSTPDALLEEVRGIRREICEQAGNDVNSLFEQLRGTESDYAARRDIFSGITKEAAERVVAGWGAEVLRTDDPLVDEVRAIRKRLADDGPG